MYSKICVEWIKIFFPSKWVEESITECYSFIVDEGCIDIIIFALFVYKFGIFLYKKFEARHNLSSKGRLGTDLEDTWILCR